MPLPVMRPFRVVSNTPLADETFELRLTPNDGAPLFSFQAGQWVMLHLLNEDGSSWGKAAFSISNAPCEAKEEIDLAIKVHGDYTKRAQTLKAGDVVNVQGPYGAFVLRPSSEPLVLFAGGIGITPMRSMLRQVLLSGESRRVVLFYSNRTRNVTAYEQELRDLAKTHPQFTVIFFATQEQAEGWDGICGRIDGARVQGVLTDVVNNDYCMCGPSPFMDAIKEMLSGLGVDVKAKLRKELF